MGAAQKLDALICQGRRDFIVEQLILMFDQLMSLFAHSFECLLCTHAIRPRRNSSQLDLFHQSGYANFEKLIEIVAADAEVFQPLQQRNSGILGLSEHAPVELELTEFTVEELLRGEFIGQDGAPCLFLGCITFWHLRTRTEEIIFHLRREIFACCQIGKIETILVHQHGLELDPSLPGFLGYIFKNPLAERAGIGRTIQPFGFTSQFYALNHSSHVVFLHLVIM
jgi:hypothetical protein